MAGERQTMVADSWETCGSAIKLVMGMVHPPGPEKVAEVAKICYYNGVSFMLAALSEMDRQITTGQLSTEAARELVLNIHAELSAFSAMQQAALSAKIEELFKGQSHDPNNAGYAGPKPNFYKPPATPRPEGNANGAIGDGEDPQHRDGG